MTSFNKRCAAEAFGTFWLVFGGCGAAILAAGVPNVGIGYLGVALAFGLSVLTMVYAVGGISGGHFNPAISVGLFVAGRFPRNELLGYILSQVGGAIVASILLYAIATGSSSFDLSAGFAANGFGEHSPGGYGLLSAALTEIILTFMFLMVILGVTDERSPKAVAPAVIGLTLTLIHLVGIPVTNTSVNPARSTGPALFAGGWALGQLWLFWVAPILGAAGASWVYLKLFSAEEGKRTVPPPQQRKAVAEGREGLAAGTA